MGGWEGESGPTSQNFTSSPFIPPHQRFIFPLNNNFHVITQYKLHFYLQSLLLYHHFFFKFMLYVHIFHASFDFSWCWYLQNVVSSIEKVQINPTYPLLPHPSSFYFQIPFWEVSPLPFGKTCKLWKDCWKNTSIVFKKKIFLIWYIFSSCACNSWFVFFRCLAIWFCNRFSRFFHWQLPFFPPRILVVAHKNHKNMPHEIRLYVCSFQSQLYSCIVSDFLVPSVLALPPTTGKEQDFS